MDGPPPNRRASWAFSEAAESARSGRVLEGVGISCRRGAAQGGPDLHDRPKPSGVGVQTVAPATPTPPRLTTQHNPKVCERFLLLGQRKPFTKAEGPRGFLDLVDFLSSWRQKVD
ncbi:hypothetical protein GCM10022251_11790 [Phytohabitans flavus]|uniref:Uncharacterized protein n=1 Tax=Phytohabitans flavus TaxID=1076124 RepID=A0A6F8XJM8_9ACTN|nr:hypothetical protein Pflav_004250 [Phytohabitans flavus]